MAENQLAIIVRYPDQPLAGLSREDCVELHGTLKLSAVGEVTATSVSGMAYKHVTGFRLGGDTDQVYERGINTLLEQLDKSMSELMASRVTVSASEGLEVPDLDLARLTDVKLSVLTPRTLELSVNDDRQPRPETSTEVVAELIQSFEEVFHRAGIAVSEGASNRLNITLQNPERGFGEARPDECIELNAILRLSSGAGATSSATSCFPRPRSVGDANYVYEKALNLVLEQLEGVLKP